MDSVPVKYLGRIVKKENFRTNVYAPTGAKKLVESWEAFETAMASGLWFSTLQDAKDSVPVVEEKPARAKRSTKKDTAVEILEASEGVIDKGPIEMIEDDFLPKESK
jgi:hypothetical protein